MAPPSKLAIATSVVQRLVKEEASYHKEQEQQEARIENFKKDSSDENAEYLLRQEYQALEDTKKVFPGLRQNIADAVSRLEALLEEHKDTEHEASAGDVTKAKEAAAAARKVLENSS